MIRPVSFIGKRLGAIRAYQVGLLTFLVLGEIGDLMARFQLDLTRIAEKLSFKPGEVLGDWA